MSYVEERLAEIRAAKALSKSKRPMSKLGHKIRSRIKASRQQGGPAFVNLDGDDVSVKARGSYEKSKQEWRDILERHIRKHSSGDRFRRRPSARTSESNR